MKMITRRVMVSII